MEKNFRLYGSPPFSVVLIHGGPGAAGSLSPLAFHIQKYSSCLEVLETKDSFMGQVEEIRAIIENNSHNEILIIGHSWGAFLGLSLCAKYPNKIKKLIIIGCGPLESSYVSLIQKTRNERLSNENRTELNHLLNMLNSLNTTDKDEVFRKFGAFFEKIDSFSLNIDEKDQRFPVKYSFQIYDKAWRSFEIYRQSGEFLNSIKNLNTELVIIHGKHDPHPLDGIFAPLKKIGIKFRFYILEKCGHSPWIEKYAKDEFYTILRREIFDEKK